MKIYGLLFPKNTFLQLKHYIQSIYLTLLSTTCMKIFQMTNVIFETISYFSRHNPCIFFFKQSVFLQTLHHSSVSRDVTLLYFFIWIFACFGQTDPIKVQFFGLSTSRMKINQTPYVICQPTSQFPLKLCNTLQCYNTFL